MIQYSAHIYIQSDYSLISSLCDVVWYRLLPINIESKFRSKERSALNMPYRRIYTLVFIIYFYLFLFSFSFCISHLQEELEKCDAFVLVFSVVDKASFTRLEQLLQSLQDMDLIRTRPVIIVANKIDLARSRAVSSQGKSSNTHLNTLYIYVRAQPYVFMVNSVVSTTHANVLKAFPQKCNT